jgi:hypothetical protein
VRIRRALVGIWLVCVAVTGVARADDRTIGFIGKDVPILEVEDCKHDDAPHDVLLKRGGEYYERGEVLYLQGDYRGAVREFVASYCEFPYYSILKDIGQAYERELDYSRAIAYLERYVREMPRDAQRANSCAPDPQEDKQNVLARIRVLEKLPAKLRVQTTPADARVSVIKDGVVVARREAGKELEVVAGPVQIVVERDGYVSVTQNEHVEIGKPYTFFVQLEPLKGRVRIRVTPSNARLFIDQRQVGTGSYDAQMPGGRYTLHAEAPDHISTSYQFDVVPEKEFTPVSIELSREPEFGRKQLLVYGGIGGFATGVSLASPQTADTNTRVGLLGLAALGGAAAGLAGVYYGTPRNISLGTSSFTVTSSLIGGAASGAIATMLADKLEVSAPALGGGLVLGALAGYYVGDRTHPSPGDAAVINSGALWGGVAGALFTVSFQSGDRIGAGLVMSGLSMGTLGGSLLQRYFTVSRGRAALIDAAGVAGIVLGLATQRTIDLATNVGKASPEQTANYMLGGLAGGLIIGGVLTRTMDDIDPGVTPAIGQVTTASGASTTTYGIGGSF